MKTWQKRLIAYGAATLVAGAFVVVYLLTHDVGGQDTTAQLMLWCNAFTIPGVVLIVAGGLVWAYGQGALNGLGYVFGEGLKALIPGARATGKHRTYYDYVEEKKSRKLAFKSYAFLFLVGGICMVFALVFLVIYYQSKG